MSILFLLLIIIQVINASSSNSSLTNYAKYNCNQAEISVWLSAAGACGSANYKSHVFQGPTKGFIVTSVISDMGTDTDGYIGYLPSDNSIYVVFRGSHSARNWITNLDAIKVDYKTYPECKCQVHKGFYNDAEKVSKRVITDITSLLKQFPNYHVKITGHSLGAAIAQLISMDVYKAGIPVSVYNFGQPRTGDAAYAAFATARVPTFRVVHNKDDVPHLPTQDIMNFKHVCTEAFEDVNGNVKICNDSCEDPSCSDQFTISELDGNDHMTYLGLYMSCEAVTL